MAETGCEWDRRSDGKLEIDQGDVGADLERSEVNQMDRRSIIEVRDGRGSD